MRKSPANPFPFLAALFGCASLLIAQRPLTHDDYDQWRSVRGQAVSDDGKWVAVQIEPQWGDGVLEVRSTDGATVYREPLGSGARFTSDGRYVVFTRAKSKVEERQKKLDELRKQGKKEPGAEGETPRTGEPAAGAGTEPGARRGGRGPGGGAPAGRRGPGAPGAAAPGATEGEGGREASELIVLDLGTGKTEQIKGVKSFETPRDLPVLVYWLDKKEPAKPAEGDAEKVEAAKPEEAKGEATKTAEPAKAEPPKVEEPKPAEPVAVEPKAVEPKTVEPKTVEPKTGEPTTEEPKGEAGTTGAPEGQRPGRGNRPRGPRNTAPAKPEDPLAKKRKDGSPLVVRDLRTGNEQRFEDVVAYGFTSKSAWLHFATSAKTPKPEATYGLFVVKPLDGQATVIHRGFADVSGITSTRDGGTLAFTSNLADFAAEKPKSALYLWDGSGEAQPILPHDSSVIPGGKELSRGGLSFSRDGSVLQFTVQDLPAPEPGKMLADEKVVLDLWHHNDGSLQPAQARGGRGGRDRNWTAVFHRNEKRVVVLGDEKIGSVRLITPDGALGIATDGEPYDKLVTWDGRYSDVYLVNTIDGSRTRILTKTRGSVTNSPSGRHLIWFDADYAWKVMDVGSRTIANLTAAIPVPFHNDDDDHPAPDPAHGVAGWVRGEQEVVLYDQFDLWRVPLKGGSAVNITDGFGRANKLRLRVQRLPRLEDELDDEDFGALPEDLLLTALDTETMAEGFYRDSLTAQQKPARAFHVEQKIGGLTKARKADRLFLSLQSFREPADLWTCDLAFGDLRRLTDCNPQQKDYRWGKAELVRWTNGDGRKLKGVLIKPDGFDPAKKYPMMVYFYERMSQNLHSYVTPQPGTSPNAAYYVSNGYLWFTPDIVYEEGYPGTSCVKCVVSGVQHLIDQGFVDERAIGAAGHSWGGYQTAYLVTRTNIFKAVESGAPVCNMISAYGGIRYGSGVSRQFQYEQTQSRIGGTPWEFPMRYWENSPIFFADRVRTPVLILHNDQDGAVPWTQGIEYFTALRRLGREVYLFNYVGEDHGIGKRQNQKDWTRRMAEYFDHHLRGAAMPKWMVDGVPFSERDEEKFPYSPSYVQLQAEAAEAAAKKGQASAEPANGGQK